VAIGDETIRSFAAAEGVDPLVGTIVDKYRVESVVGTGAMGIVYGGVDVRIGKRVAIKVLKQDYADDPDMVQRLIREAKTVNAIRHPSIINTFDYGNLPRTGQPYIVMDLLEGEPLDTWISHEAPVSLRVATSILDDLLSALAAAHQVGVIHRDLKPGNCFLESHDGAKHLTLLDFGLSRQADRAGGSIRPTNPNTLIGTPAFMAPEQVLGDKLTPATDIYAFAGIAYQMLTGHLPHEAPSAIEVLTQKMKFDPVRPRRWVATIDEEVDAWVMSLLERDPERRERDAEVVRKQLRHLSQTRTVSGSRAVLPVKREWSEARTILVDPKPPESATASHLSPWAQDAQARSTVPATSSPFAVPNSTPPSPTLPMTSGRSLPAVVLPPKPDDSTLPAQARRTVQVEAPDEEAEAPSARGLYLALGVTVTTLVIGLIWLLRQLT
jgi:serine/threonine-protein kinase